jgi:hypothetical protein
MGEDQKLVSITSMRVPVLLHGNQGREIETEVD